MSSIPLPALDIKPVQQPNSMEQLGQLMAMRNAIQEQPLRMQAMQQQVQAGQLENQQRQIQVNDQQAMTKAMQSWDGKDYNDILPLVIKNGGSAQAVMGLKSKILEQQQSISTALKNNADAASAQMTAAKTKGDLLDGALSPLLDPKQVPDAQLPQAVVSTAQDLAQKGVLDPAHAQLAAKLAQLPPDQIRQQIDLIRKSNVAQSQILEDALKKSQTQEASSRANEADVNAQKAQMEMQLGTGPMADSRYRNILMAERLGRPVTPEDLAFKAAYEKQKTLVPQFNVNMQGALLNDAAKQMAAQNYAQTGQLPTGMRSPGMSAAILNAAAQQNPGVDIAANKASYQADTKSLESLQKNFDQVQAFEQTASKNIDLLQNTAAKIPDLGAKFANVPVRMITGNMIGMQNMAAFKTALNTAQIEAAKVLNSSNATGVLSDSARHELQQIIDGNMPYPAMVASLNTLKQDMANRTQAYQGQITDIKGRISGKPAQEAPEKLAAPPTGATMKVPGSDGKLHWSDGKRDLGVAE